MQAQGYIVSVIDISKAHQLGSDVAPAVFEDSYFQRALGETREMVFDLPALGVRCGRNEYVDSAGHVLQVLDDFRAQVGIKTWMMAHSR